MKKAWGVILIGLLLFAVFGCESKEKKQDIAGRVNGQEITLQEYQQQVAFLGSSYRVVQARMQANSGSGNNSVQPGDIEIDDSLKTQINEQVFQDLVMNIVLLPEISKREITVTDAEVEDILKSLKDLHESMGGEGTYKDFLAYSKLTEAQVKEKLKQDLLKDKLSQSLAAEAVISDEDARQYYENHQDLYTQAAGIQISHILVDEEDLAHELIARLQKGQDFAVLAGEYSTCPSKEKGGDLGLVNEESSLVTEFKTVALALQPGQITEQPVKTRFGYHIIKAGNKKEAVLMPFDEIKNEIINLLRQEYANTYQQEMYQQAEIEDLRK